MPELKRPSDDPNSTRSSSQEKPVSSDGNHRGSLTLKDYLETAADASRRTRFITIAMIVASVLVLVSVLNSWDQGWISVRINNLQRKKIYAIRQFPLLCMCSEDEVKQTNCKQLTDQDKEDVQDVFARVDAEEKRLAAMKNETLEEYKQQETALTALNAFKRSKCDEEKTKLDKFIDALVKSAAETKYTVHVPFFGVAFDINDVGILGGVALSAVLILLRLSLRSQIVSLRVGFKKAFGWNEEAEFYDVLAARQVFIFPPLSHEHQQVVRMRGWIETFWQGLKLMDRSTDEWQANRNAGLRFVPQFLSLLPSFIYSLQFYNDIYSRRYGFELAPQRTWVLLTLEGLFLLFIFVFGMWCITKWNELDKLWDYYDEHIKEKRKPLKTFEDRSF